MTKSNAIAIAILAGGEGSRIGGNKPFVRLGTSTLLERSWKFASAFSDKVTIVLRTPDLAGASDYPIVTDRPDIEGPLGGLASALAWAKSEGREAVVTIPCDMPFLPSDLVERLTNEIGGKAAAIAASDGRIHPVCGLWKVTVIEELEAYSESGERSLQGLARAVGFTQIEWPVQEVDPFFNINSQGDLAKARAHLETRN
jgi:molybdopterin-guanine dinucleotide biosynthesis protein A